MVGASLQSNCGNYQGEGLIMKSILRISRLMTITILIRRCIRLVSPKFYPSTFGVNWFTNKNIQNRTPDRVNSVLVIRKQWINCHWSSQGLKFSSSHGSR